MKRESDHTVSGHPLMLELEIFRNFHSYEGLYALEVRTWHNYYNTGIELLRYITLPAMIYTKNHEYQVPWYV